jgi:hypothetical protein
MVLSREDDATDFKYLAARLRLKWRSGVLAILFGGLVFGGLYCLFFIGLPPTLYESVTLFQVEYTALVGEEKEGSYWNAQQWNAWLEEELSLESEQSLGSKLSKDSGLFQESEDTEGSLDRILEEAITLTMPWDHSLISLQILTKDAMQTQRISDSLRSILPERIKQTAIIASGNQDGSDASNAPTTSNAQNTPNTQNNPNTQNAQNTEQVVVNDNGLPERPTGDTSLASVTQVRVVDTTPVHKLLRDTRPLNASVLGFALSALFVFTMMSLRELRSDRIELPMDAWVQFRLRALPWEIFLRIKQRSSVNEDSSTAFNSTYYFIGNQDDYTQLQDALQKELSSTCYYIDMKEIHQEQFAHEYLEQEPQCDERDQDDHLKKSSYIEKDGEPPRNAGTLILQSGYPMTATMRAILRTGMIPMNPSISMNQPQYFDRVLLWKVNPKLFRLYYRN